MNGLPEWFGGDRPRTSAEAAFLDEIRSSRWGWDATGLAPADTSALTILVPLLVIVDVPWVPGGIRSLHVGYWSTGDADTICLRAEWGDGHPMDNGGAGDDLEIPGIGLSPAEAAQLSARWLLAQLGRPVDREEWTDASGGRAAARWRLVDSGRVLERQGSWFARRFHEPSSTTRVRVSD